LWDSGGIMKRKIRIFDNGGLSFDRYTLLLGEDAFGMSYNPLSHQGFNQYIGYSKDIKINCLGNEITDKYHSLPHDLFVAIHQRVNK
jgi:hypothetical protein